MPLARGLTGRVELVHSRALELTLRRGCQPSGVFLLVDGRSRGQIRVASRAWHMYRIALALPAGPHRLSIRTSATRACAMPWLDRIDAVPAAPPHMALGAAVRWDIARSDPRYRAAFTAHFGSLTPENELKMEVVEPARGRFEFAAADGLAALAGSRRIRGHTLVYGNQLPRWVTHPGSPWTRDSLLAVLHDYISTVVRRYRRRIDTWDVVNEVIADDGSLRPTVWLDVIGPEYIEHAFRWAHAADPTARLFYNDIGLERDTAKARSAVRMLSTLRRRGVPVDGVGMQDHTEVVNYPRQSTLETSFRRFAALGLAVEITELDVGTLDGPSSPGARAEAQARAYRDAASACWDIAACNRLTVWGVGDAASWIGPAQTPLLLDGSYRAKPVYDIVRRRLHITNRG